MLLLLLNGRMDDPLQSFRFSVKIPKASKANIGFVTVFR